ncbi:MAG: hypothetical protein J6U21_09125, partial [Bacteroidales bacterium]|nr:hypothetical protein [Bacteroidales bacterium]
MTLSEIENRIKEITKELDELQKKAEEYCRTHSNNSKIGYAGIVASTISFRTVFGAVAGLVC